MSAAATPLTSGTLSITQGVFQILEFVRTDKITSAREVVEDLKIQKMAREKWRLLSCFIDKKDTAKLASLHQYLVARKDSSASEDAIFTQWKKAQNTTEATAVAVVSKKEKSLSSDELGITTTIVEELMKCPLDFLCLPYLEMMSATFLQFVEKNLNKNDALGMRLKYLNGIDEYLTKGKTDRLAKILSDLDSKLAKQSSQISDLLLFQYDIFKNLTDKSWLKLSALDLREQVQSNPVLKNLKIPAPKYALTPTNQRQAFENMAFSMWKKLNLAMLEYSNQSIYFWSSAGDEFKRKNAKIKNEQTGVSLKGQAESLTEAFIQMNPHLSSSFKVLFVKNYRQYIAEAFDTNVWSIEPLLEQSVSLLNDERTIENWKNIYEQVEVFCLWRINRGIYQFHLLKRFSNLNILIRTADLKKLEDEWKQSKLPFYKFLCNKVDSFKQTQEITRNVLSFEPTFLDVNRAVQDYAQLLEIENSFLNGLFDLLLETCRRLDTRLQEVFKISAKTKKLPVNAGPCVTALQPSEPRDDRKDFKSNLAIALSEDVALSPAIAAAVIPMNNFANIEKLIGDSVADLTQVLAKPGAKEAISNAKIHIMNTFRQMQRITLAIQKPLEKESAFCEVVKWVEEGVLALEQLLCSLSLQIHNQNSNTTREYFTHDLSIHLESCKSHLPGISIQDRVSILGLNKGEILARKIARLYIGDRPSTIVENLLIDMYRWYLDPAIKELPAALLGQITHFNHTLFSLFFKLSKAFTRSLSKKNASDLNELLDQFSLYLNQCRTGARASVLATASSIPKTETNPMIEALQKLINSFDAGYFSYHHANIQMNVMRLKIEMSQQSTLPSQDIALHMATVLKLNQLIVEEVLETMVSLKGIVLEREKIAHNCWKLVEMLKLENKFTADEKTFLSKGRVVRNEARYMVSEGTKNKGSILKKDLKKAVQISKQDSVASTVLLEDGFELSKQEAAMAQHLENCKKRAQEDVKTLLEILKKLFS